MELGTNHMLQKMTVKLVEASNNAKMTDEHWKPLNTWELIILKCLAHSGTILERFQD